MAPKDLEKLAKICRKYGINRLKTADIELSIDLAPVTPQEAAISEPEKPQTSYTDEDALFWSSGSVPEV